MIKLIGLLLVVTCVMLSVDAQAYAKRVTLANFLSMLASHPYMLAQTRSSAIEKLNRDSVAGGQDWQSSIKSDANYNEQKDRINPQFENSTTLTTSMGLSRKVWSTGGDFSIDYSHSNQDTTPITSLSDQVYKYNSNTLSASYSHPLLRNFAGNQTRLDYDLAVLNINTTELDTFENKENFLLEQALIFVDWVALHQQWLVNEQRLKLSKQDLLSTQKKFNAALVEKIDVLLQQDAVRSAEQSLLLSQADLKAVQALLASNTDMATILTSQPQMDLYQLVPVPAFIESSQQILTRSRVLKSLQIQESQVKRRKVALTDGKKPKLDLVLKASIAGDDPSYFNSFGDAAGFEGSDVSIGIEFSYPLGNRSAYADLAKVNEELYQFKDNIHAEQRNLLSNVHSYTAQLQVFTQLLQLNKKQIQAAEKRTEEEQKRYQQGRGDATFVIQAMDNEQAIKLSYINNAANYQKLILQYQAITDQFLDRADILL